MRNALVPVVVCVDVEPDLDFFLVDKSPEERKSANTWRGFRAAKDLFESMRATISKHQSEQARFAWFVRADPQVESDFGAADFGFREFKDVVASWRDIGDEIALHVHAWRYDSGRQMWADDRADRAWVKHCVETGFRAYTTHMGRPPNSFRFGNRWIDKETMNRIKQLGARVDMTIEPGYRDSPHSPHLKGLTDWRGVPRAPYSPSDNDYVQPTQFGGRHDFYELPISTVPRSLKDKLGRIVDVSFSISKGERTRVDKPHGPFLQELLFFLRSRFESLYLGDSTSRFQGALRWLLSSNDIPYLAMVVRSDDCLDGSICDRMIRNIQLIVKEIGRSNMRASFVTPTSALSLLSLE